MALNKWCQDCVFTENKETGFVLHKTAKTPKLQA